MSAAYDRELNRKVKVFISHSSINYIKAAYICEYLEERDISCWMAPRDIPLGVEYGRSIVDAFEECTAAIFLISKESLKSTQVEQELYLANSLQQKKGFRIFPVFIESVELKGSFQYVLHSKQAFNWESGIAEELDLLIDALSDDKKSVEKSFENSRKILGEGIKKFYEIYSLKFCDADISDELLPKVIDYEQWLGDISAISLIESAKLLWEKSEWGCLYVGKSGFGKTVGLFLLMKYFIENYPEILVFYVPMDASATYDGEDKITRYIYKHYVKQFGIRYSFEDLKILLEGNEKKELFPQLILLLDGLSDSVNEYYEEIQMEIDKFRMNKNMQLLISSRTVQHPYSLGNISVQRFDLQKLSKQQIDQYLKSVNIIRNHEKDVPYNILSNPLILTLFAKTNNFLKEYQGEYTCYIRKEILSEADVLWNFLEMISLKYCKKQTSEVRKIKFLFLFRISLPKIAFYMEMHHMNTISMRELVNCIRESVELLKDDEFCDVFDEYYGYEDEIIFEKIECKKIVENIFVQQLGLLKKNEFGYFVFSNQIFQHFYAAVFLYRHIIVANKVKRRLKQFESTFFHTKFVVILVNYLWNI